MRDYQTAEEWLAAYIESEDLELDIDWLRNEYLQTGQPIPTQEELRGEAVNGMKTWLASFMICKINGHQLEETAGGENGISDLFCNCCGFSHRFQW